jgi:hypothetical protein
MLAVRDCVLACDVEYIRPIQTGRHDLTSQPPPFERSEDRGEASRAMRRRRERGGWGQLKPNYLELLGQ